MEKPTLMQATKMALAAAALIATAMALYVQLFERSSREEEDRLLASRLETTLEASRARLKDEILAELRAELAKSESPARRGDQPLSGSVLRRSESARDRGLQQVGPSKGEEEAALDRIDSLTRQVDQNDSILRRDLTEIRAAVRREQNVNAKVLNLLIAALFCLLLHRIATLFTGRS
jgi:hypothetical protein